MTRHGGGNVGQRKGGRQVGKPIGGHKRKGGGRAPGGKFSH